MLFTTLYLKGDDLSPGAVTDLLGVKPSSTQRKGQASTSKGNKDIVVVRPKYAWVTSHTCRRSFCTNEFLAGTPVDLIMKISGHKSLRDFYKYIRITPEEAGQKIKDIWQTRGDMNLIKEASISNR